MQNDEPITTQEKNLAIQFPGELRDWFAGKAPAEEIANIGGSTTAECAAYLGIKEYRFQDHYLTLVAKARYEWADAMLAERAK